MIPTFAFPVDHFFVSEYRTESWAPIHQRVVLIRQTMLVAVLGNRIGTLGGYRLRNGQFADGSPFLGDRIVPSIEKDQKDPLSPAEVFDVGGGQASIPIVREPEHLKLPSKVRDVGFGALAWRCVGPDRILFGRQTERIVSHRMQYRLATVAPISAIDVRRGVSFGVTDVQSGSAGVREHIEDIQFPCAVRIRHLRAAERLVRLPIALPLRLNDGGVITRHRDSVRGLSEWRNKNNRVAFTERKGNRKPPIDLDSIRPDGSF